MAELLLSSVSKHGINVSTLSENYATNHKIHLRGQQSKAGGICVASINGNTLNPSNKSGLNVINVSAAGDVLAADTFYFGTVGHDTNFINWMNARTQGLVLCLSNTSNRSTTKLDTYMSTLSFKNWSNYWRTGTESEFMSFVGIYDVGLKKFTSKQFMPPLADSIPAEIVQVIDAIANNGVTGYGEALIYDNTETIGVKTTTHDYFRWAYKTPITQFNVKVGENIHCVLESWKDDLAADAGEFNTLIFNFYDDASVWKGGFDLNDNTTPANVWTRYTKDLKVPVGATNYSIYVRQDPSTPGATKLGSVGIRNLVIYPSRVVPSGNTDVQTFKTAFASEVSGTNPIVSTGEPDLKALNINTIDSRFSPKFEASYIIAPPWTNTQTFEFNQDIVWDYSTQTIMKSGGVQVSHGLNRTNPLNYTHEFDYGSDRTNYPVENLTYSEPFNYRTVVTPTQVKHYVNGVLLGTKAITNHPPVLNLDIGATFGVGIIDGTVLEMCIIDKPHNTRIYELQQTSATTSTVISGRSQIAKTPTVSSVVGGTGFTISTAVSSPAFACGLTNGDSVYVTVKSFGSAVAKSGIVVNTRYECLVINNLLSHPTAGVNWISAGNMSDVQLICEYTPNPDINAVFDSPKWIEKQKLMFNGAVKIQDVKVLADETGTLSLKFMIGDNNLGGCLFDGSARVDVTDALLLTTFGCKILTVNDEVFVNQKLTKLIPYCIVVSLNPATIVKSIGSKVDNNLPFGGNMWDIDFKTHFSSLIKKLNYENKFESYHRFTLYGLPAYGTGYVSYSNFSTVDWEVYNSTLIPRYSFKSTANGDFAITKDVGITAYSRIEFDITAPVGKSCQILLDGAVLRTLGSHGRYVGSVSGNRVGKLSIKIIGAVANSIVTINRLTVYNNVLDGTSSFSTGNAIPRLPDIERVVDKQWLPVMTSNRLNFNWITQGKFYMHFDLVLKAGYHPIVSGHTSRTIELELKDNEIRLFTITGGVFSTIVRLPYSPSLNDTRITFSVLSYTKNVGMPNSTNVVEMKIHGGPSITVDNWNGAIDSIANFLGYAGKSATYGGLDVYSYQLSNMTDDMNYKSTCTFNPLINWVEQPDITYLKARGVSLFKLYMLGTAGNIGWKFNADPKLEIGRLRDSHYINNNKLIRVGQSNTTGFSMDLEFENGITPFDNIEITLQDVTPDGTRGYNVGTYIATKNNKAYRILKNQNVDAWFDSSSTKSFECYEAGPELRAVFQNKPTWKAV